MVVMVVFHEDIIVKKFLLLVANVLMMVEEVFPLHQVKADFVIFGPCSALPRQEGEGF
jgi:hypothetical protein